MRQGMGDRHLRQQIAQQLSLERLIELDKASRRALGFKRDYLLFVLSNGRLELWILEASVRSDAPATVLPSRLAFPHSVFHQLQCRLRVARLNDFYELAMDRLQVTHRAVRTLLELEKRLRNIHPLIFNWLSVERIDCPGLKACTRQEPREKGPVLPEIGELKRVL